MKKGVIKVSVLEVTSEHYNDRDFNIEIAANEHASYEFSC